MIYIIYYSETGNTKKIADAIFDGISKEREIVKMEDFGYDKMEKSEITFIGSPVHAGGLPKTVKAFMKDLLSIEGSVALFFTHASPKDMGMVSGAIKAAEKYLKDKNIDVKSSFDCLGEVKAEQLMKMPMIKNTEKYWRGHPDDDDVESAKSWARGLVE